VVLAPLRVDEPLGLLTVHWARTIRVDDGDVLAAIRSFASLGAMAIDRAALVRAVREGQRQARYPELASEVARLTATAQSATVLVGRLSRLVVEDGLRVVGLMVRDRTACRVLKAQPLSSQELRGWRASREPLELGNDVWALPACWGSRVIGSVHFTAGSPPEGEKLRLMEAVSRAVADGLDRARPKIALDLVLQQGASIRERDVLIESGSRDCIALLRGVRPHARQLLDHLPSSGGGRVVLAGLLRTIEEAHLILHASLRAAKHMPTPEVRLLPALERLSVEARVLDLDVVFKTKGQPSWMPLNSERAVYRAAFEALRAARQARASAARLRLEYHSQEAHLVVEHGGGSPTAEEQDRGSYARLRNLARLMGGALEVGTIHPSLPRGVGVRVIVPTPPRPPRTRRML
jgi:hypothetical protein